MQNNDETSSMKPGSDLNGEPVAVDCAGGCGFFGRPETANMCSKCFKDCQAEKGASVPVPAAAPGAPMEPEPEQAAICVPCAGSEGNPDPTSVTPVKKKAKNRCLVCRKKVGLTGIACRCGGMYCGAHRMSSAHQCTFDYKAHSAAQLLSSGRVDKVVPDKVDKF